MSSVSFDPVAHMYDATRGYPDHVARQVAEEMECAVDGNAQTRFLEVGVGARIDEEFSQEERLEINRTQI